MAGKPANNEYANACGTRTKPNTIPAIVSAQSKSKYSASYGPHIYRVNHPVIFNYC